MQKNIKWDLLKVFYAIAQSKSISAASNSLNTDQSTISRSLKNLETCLDVQLFKRQRSGVEITKQGKILFDVVSSFSQNLNIAVKEINQNFSKEPQGEIILSSPVGFGTFVISDLVRKFVEKYPKIQITLIFTNYRNSIPVNDIDVSFATHPEKESKATSIPFFNSSRYAFASIKYLKRYGTPKTIAELENHRIITTITNNATSVDKNYINFSKNVKQKAIIVNSFKMAHELASKDAGIAALPDYMISEDDNLVKIFKNLELENRMYYMILPHETKNMSSIKLFQDFILEEIRKYRK